MSWFDFISRYYNSKVAYYIHGQYVSNEGTGIANWLKEWMIATRIGEFNEMKDEWVNWMQSQYEWRDWIAELRNCKWRNEGKTTGMKRK